MSTSPFRDMREELKKSSHRCFRRLYMKRRKPALYESTWQRIPDKYVKSWGAIGYNLDDVRINFFTQADLQMTVRNDDGFFNDVTDVRSFFYGAVSRYRTLVKIEAGYIDSIGSELPTSSTQYVGFVNDEMPIDENCQADLKTRNLTGIFDEIPAGDIAGLGSTQTASQIIEKIRDATDGAGNVIFRQYISATSWSIQATTQFYNIATSTSLNNLKTFDLMKKVAEAEGFVFYVTRDGRFRFVDRTANTVGTEFFEQTSTVATTTTSTVTSSSIILWHKMEGTGTSEIGNNPTFDAGSVFNAAKFGNGWNCDTATNADFGSLNPATVTFAFGFWAKMKHDRADGQYHFILNYYPNVGFETFFLPSGNLQVAVYGPVGGYRSYYVFSTSSYLTNDLVHWGLSFNPADADKIRCWQGTTELGIISKDVDNSWIDTQFDFKFNEKSSDIYFGDFILDNIKAYKAPKTDWSDEIASEAGGAYNTTSTTAYTTTTATITVTTEYKFVGLGQRDTEFGMNIKERIEVGEPFSKLYNRIRIKHDEASTETSYYTFKENWSWGDSSTSYKFGVRTLEINNEWLTASTSAILAQSLYNEYSVLKNELKITTKFIPHVSILDCVRVKYITPKMRIKYENLWGHFLWGNAVWNRSPGNNLKIDNAQYKIIHASHDLDTFESTWRMRENG